MLIADNAPLCYDNTPQCTAACQAYCPLTGLIPDSQNPNHCECFLPYMAGTVAARVNAALRVVVYQLLLLSVPCYHYTR